MKPRKTIPRKPAIASSNLRCPRVCSSRMAKATTAVIRPAANGGTPKSRLSAIAAPTNSARSVAIAIASACSQRPNVTGLLEVLAAQLGQVLAGGDAGLGRQVLHEHRHQVRGDDDPQQHVAVLGAARDVGGEVARVDVGDRGDERRAEHARPRRGRGRARGPARSGDARRGHGRAGRGGARPRSSSAGSQRGPASRSASWPPSACVAPVDLDEQRAAERLLVDHPHARARHDLARGEVAQDLRLGVARSARRSPPRPARASPGRRSAPRRARGRRTGSGRRAGRASGGRAWRRSAPRAPRRGRARAPRPPGARGPTARRATRPGRAPAAGGGGSSPARAACRPRSAARRGSARG